MYTCIYLEDIFIVDGSWSETEEVVHMVETVKGTIAAKTHTWKLTTKIYQKQTGTVLYLILTRCRWLGSRKNKYALIWKHFIIAFPSILRWRFKSILLKQLIYSKIPLLRPPKIKTTSPLKSIFKRCQSFFLCVFCTRCLLEKVHHWDCSKVVLKTTFEQSQRWSYYRNFTVFLWH